MTDKLYMPANTLHSTRSTLPLSDQPISSNVVFKLQVNCASLRYEIALYTVHSQPSYCLTNQYHPLWFLRSTVPACDMIALYTVHGQPSYCLTNHDHPLWFLRLTVPACNMIPCATQCTVNPPTVWPSNIIHCDFLMTDNLWQPAIWYHVLHSTLSTLPTVLLSDHHPLQFLNDR